MIIAHLSDFHICAFGARLTQLQDAPRRGVPVGRGWTTIRREGDWRIQKRRASDSSFRIRDQLRLVDDNGIVHKVVKTFWGVGEPRAIDELLRLAEARQRNTPQGLAEDFPGESELETRLAHDPENLNLRFCAVAHAMRRDNPDRVVITGDLTDNADGFDLILRGLEPFFEQGRVACVPGNHDIYDTPPLWVRKAHRKKEPEKRLLWATFASSVGLPAKGSYVRDLGDGVVLAAFDSCHRAALPGSASGMVHDRDLHQVARELDGLGLHVRIACLHHHVVNPPLRHVGFSPIQAGMRLRNAKRVFTLMQELGFHLVMNGHRHVGYRYHPAHAPLFLSAPSSTIGCRSGQKPYYWRIEVGQEGLGAVREVPIPPRF